MAKKETISVKGTEIILLSHKKDDYISLTDMAKFKNAEATGLVIAHWLSTRYTVDFLGIWERINNPDFNVTEFGNIRNETGTNGFILSSKQWRDANPDLKGNVRDYATIEQLVVLSNMVKY